MKIQLRNNANKVYCYTVSTIKFLCSLTDHILHTNVKVACLHQTSTTCHPRVAAFELNMLQLYYAYKVTFSVLHFNFLFTSMPFGKLVFLLLDKN